MREVSVCRILKQIQVQNWVGRTWRHEHAWGSCLSVLVIHCWAPSTKEVYLVAQTAHTS